MGVFGPKCETRPVRAEVPPNTHKGEEQRDGGRFPDSRLTACRRYPYVAAGNFPPNRPADRKSRMAKRPKTCFEPTAPRYCEAIDTLA